MSLNLEYVSAAKSTESKLSAAGIGAVSGNQMIRTLSRLGLIESSSQVEKLVANGLRLDQLITKKFSIYEIDQALARTEATTSARMDFKAALKAQNLIELSHK